MATLMTVPSLVGKKTYLRPATAEDIQQTEHWFLVQDPTLLDNRPRAIHTAAEAAESFKKAGRSTEHEEFVVARKDNPTPIGRIRYFDYNPMISAAELRLLIDPEFVRKGFGSEALHLLISYLFDERSLLKVYGEIASFNQPAIGLVERFGFRRDGVLRRHHFHAGELHDRYLYSLLQYEYERPRWLLKPPHRR